MMMIFQLLFVGFILARSGASGEAGDVLRSFSAKSTLTLNKAKIYNTFVIEEVYDDRSSLAKLTIHHGSKGERLEYFARLKDDLYLVANFGADNRMVGCLASRSIDGLQGDGGLFANFKLLHDFVKTLAGNQRWASSSHILGPSVIFHIFADELLAAATGDGEKASVDTRKVPKFDRTFTFHDEPKLVKASNDKSQGVLVFATDPRFSRSQLMSQLGAGYIFWSGDDILFSVDYRIMDELQIDLTMEDPFKLPGAFSCDSYEPLTTQSFRLDETWAMRLNFKSDYASFTMKDLATHPDGIHFAIDMYKQLLRYDILGRSRNVIDVRQRVLFFMPNEPVLGEQLGQDQAGSDLGVVRNKECSIIACDAFKHFDRLAGPYNRLTSHDRWQVLVGFTNYVIYLGLAQHRGILAHEFELAYESVSDLPAFFSLFTHKNTMKPSQGPEVDMIAARIWLSLESCPQSFYDSFVTCENPIILGFKAFLVDRKTQQRIEMGQMTLRDFAWDLTDQGAAVLRYEMFDVSLCPLDKVSLSLGTRWTSSREESTELLARQACSQRDDLNTLIAKEMIEHIETYANREIILNSIRGGHLLGTRSARHTLNLIFEPKRALRFRINLRMVLPEFMRSNLIAKSESARTMVECMAESSLHPLGVAFLYSESGGCLIYDGGQHVDSSFDDTNPNLSYLCTRTVGSVDSTGSANSPSSRELFLASQLDQINEEISVSGKWRNEREACLSDLTLIKDIRFSRLKVVEDETETHSASLAKFGFKFKQNYVETQLEVASFSRCQNECQDNPNCASFVHCNYEDSQICQISNKTLTDGDESSLASRDGSCLVYSKNFLVHFERETLYQMSWNDQNKFKTISEGASESLCAQTCLARDDETCLQFIHCGASQEGQSLCIQMSTGPDTNGPQLNVAIGRKCTSFKRKSISMYAKSLSYTSDDGSPNEWAIESGADGPQLVARSSLQHLTDVELCARSCVDDVECESFDFCLIEASNSNINNKRASASHYSLTKSECSLLRGSIYDQSKRRMLLASAFGQINQQSAGANGSTPATTTHRFCDHYERLAAQTRLSSDKASKILRSFKRMSASDETLPPPATPLEASFVVMLLLFMTAGLVGLALGVAASMKLAPYER